MYTPQKAFDLVDAYYFLIPNGETHADAFKRAKEQALRDLNAMKVEDFKKVKYKLK